jgi:Mrp family chromosome partitioning ATPase
MDKSRSSRTVADTLVELARKWRLIVPFAVVTPLVVFASASSQPAVYSSSADVLLNRQGFVISNLQDPTFWYPNRAQLTQARLARLPEVAQRVVDAAGLADRGRYGFLAQSWVQAGQYTDVMTFHVRDSDPRLAARLATIYAEQYIAYRRAVDTHSLRRATRVVDRQLAQASSGSRDPVLYADLVQKQQRLHTALASVETNARLVRSGGDAVRIAPQPLRDAVLALALGLLIGVGLAGLSGLLDPRAKTAAEISSQLALPLLGRLPLDAGASRRRSILELERRDGDPYAEAMQLLRTSLELDERARGLRVLMVASAGADEGKSTTVANLAVSLARAGRDVVLVDLDLRRPAISRLFDLSRSTGITDVVRGMAQLEEAVHLVQLNRSSHGVSGAPGDGDGSSESLRVVPTGTHVRDSTQIVAGSPLPSALGLLREHADIVLVDSPPLLESSDAFTLSTYVDGLLVVAQTGRYRTTYSNELRRLLALSPAKPLGLVVIGGWHEREPLPRDAYRDRRDIDLGPNALGRA